MLEYVRGEIAELTPANVVIDCNGVGYSVNISLNTYSALQGKTQCKVYVYEAIREDAHLLFGFFDRRERDCFLLLITVSGVGANTARMILSSLTVDELEQAIVGNNANILKSVKGIGLKTAQRIIVDLKDKVTVTAGEADLGLPAMPEKNKVKDEAVAALVILGFPQAASVKAVDKIVNELPNITVEQVIKNALRML